ncbi:MAG: DUF4212 domain-containing protein [Planctomycetota bacterium]
MPDPAVEAIKRSYWRANVQTMALLLGLWAFVGLGCGILWADWLNQWQLAGIPLGFWFAQQGSILVFVGIILVYAIVMNRLDTRTRKELAALENTPSTETDPAENDAS